MGSRALRHWLTHPLRDRARRDASATTRSRRCSAARHRARCARRCAASATSSASPRASRCARCARASSPACARRSPALPRAARRAAGATGSALLDMLGEALAPPAEIATPARRAIADEPAALLRDGGVIAAGFDAELDELRAHRPTTATRILLELEARERERTGIANLRVAVQPRARLLHRGHARRRSSKVPADYQRRQTMKNAERFITPELKAFEDKALSARRARARAREGALRAAARRAAAAPRGAARRWRARSPRSTRSPRSPSARRRSSWCRPALRRASRCIEIERGRHPVVEARLQESGSAVHRQRLPARRAPPACSSSPARTWAARAPSCARSR